MIPFQKIFNGKKQFYDLAHNRYVLYFLLFISIANLYYLMVNNEGILFIVFILVAFLTSFFCKNIVVILFLAICLTNILRYGTDISVNEGFEDAITTNDDETAKPENLVNDETLGMVKDIKKHSNDILDVQNEILDNMIKIDPLFDKAKTLLKKFDEYKRSKKDIFAKMGLSEKEGLALASSPISFAKSPAPSSAPAPAPK
jgi:hypothetical protein